MVLVVIVVVVVRVVVMFGEEVEVDSKVVLVMVKDCSRGSEAKAVMLYESLTGACERLENLRTVYDMI